MQTLYEVLLLLLIVYIRIALIKACPHLRTQGEDVICSQAELSNVHHVLLLISAAVYFARNLLEYSKPTKSKRSPNWSWICPTHCIVSLQPLLLFSAIPRTTTNKLFFKFVALTCLASTFLPLFSYHIILFFPHLTSSSFHSNSKLKCFKNDLFIFAVINSLLKCPVATFAGSFSELLSSSVFLIFLI